jgi:hypothetical protein
MHSRGASAALRGLALCAGVLGGQAASPQTVFQGRFEAAVRAGSAERFPITSAYVFASRDGPGAQSLAGRTAHEKLPWDTAPIGGYRLAGLEGAYTIALSNPGHFARPVLVTNQHGGRGETIERNASAWFHDASFEKPAAAPAPAPEHWHRFTARGPSITGVGFLLAGEVTSADQAASRDILVSIHRAGDGPASAREPIGPAVRVPHVDLRGLAPQGIGARGFPWSCGWASGEVPVKPGEPLAVRLRAESPAAAFRPLWVAVAGDGDGLVIPYARRVHREPALTARFAPRWSQTYVARGRSLAAVIAHAACAGEQIPISRQRVAVRVRRGGPDGPVVGVEKIASGTGTWTGDASWGAFGAAFAPGEVPLEPGTTYALELESIETAATLGGFVNIKGVPSGALGGLTPFRRLPEDEDAHGTAYLGGREAMGYDLDWQIVEYEHAAERWSEAVEGPDLLATAWRDFSIEPGTTLERAEDAGAPGGTLLRVAGGGATRQKADGGFLQRVADLSPGETYRLVGRVRSTWAADDVRHCLVGFDPTGQETDPLARSIVWTTLPAVAGELVPYASAPIRPVRDAVSIWLRGRTTAATASPIAVQLDPFAFRAEFAAFELRRAASGPPPAVR